MRVLVLRPDEGAQRTAARLAALGHEAICAPVLTSVATNEAPPPGVFDAAIATSAQAFRHIDPAAIQPFLTLPLMCVGARTTQAARQAGFGDIAAEAPDAAALALCVAQSGRAWKRALYLAGRDRKPGLEAALKAKGFIVAPWVVYEARAADALPAEAQNALRAGRVDAALHFSRRSAEIFCALVAAHTLAREARSLLHVAISQDAALGLASLAPLRLRTATAPDEAHMLAQLG